jgi:hypothetical protein
MNQASYFSNVRKAIEVVKRTNGIAHRYFIREEDFVNGNRPIILCFMEDLIRFYDGVSNRDTSNHSMMLFE